MAIDSYSGESKLWKVDEDDTNKLTVYFTSEHIGVEDITRYAKSVKRYSSPKLSYVTNFIDLTEDLQID